MTKTLKKTPVKGGTVVRNAKSGRFVSVESGGKTFKGKAKSNEVVQHATASRNAALKRLADR